MKGRSPIKQFDYNNVMSANPMQDPNNGLYMQARNRINQVQQQTTNANRALSYNNTINPNLGLNTQQPSILSPMMRMNKGMEYNKINPKAFSHSGTIKNMMGNSVPGTFNRSVSPLKQVVDPLTGESIDPTMDQSANMPIVPPTGVRTDITPDYEINNM